MSELEALIQKIRSFNKEREWDRFHSPKNLATALMIETAELTEVFQWLTEGESRELEPMDISRVEDEIGDILIYLLNLSDKLKIDPVRAAIQKIEKNEKRYPVDKAHGNAIKYTYFKQDTEDTNSNNNE